jgi:hypothetical protein
MFHILHLLDELQPSIFKFSSVMGNEVEFVVRIEMYLYMYFAFDTANESTKGFKSELITRSLCMLLRALGTFGIM